MARIQIVQLPQQGAVIDGVETYEIPFLVLLDEVSPELDEILTETVAGIKETSGARGVLVFEHRVDVVPPWQYGTTEEIELEEPTDLEKLDSMLTARGQ